MSRLFPLRLRRWLVAAIALAAIALSLVRLEGARSGVTRTEIAVAETPVTLYRGAAPGPLVIVAHGFAGSRQMMGAISHDLARAGYVVAAFDFIGHGRHPLRLSPDITRIEGTTAGLVAQTVGVTRAVADRVGAEGPVFLVGHSMATDVILRAAQQLRGVGALAAISMYSETLTADFPKRLLILSGAWEKRLREVALDAVHMVDPAVGEGVTARSDDVERRAAVAPRVEHVGVLFSPQTLEEIRAWFAPVSGLASGSDSRATGPWILTLLAGVAVLFWPLAGVLSRRKSVPVELSWWRLLLAVVLPAAVAAPATLLLPSAMVATQAFGAMAMFFGAWGLVQLALLWQWGWRGGVVSLPALLLLAGWGLGVFALALDRYGASFVPTDLRLFLMFGMLPATVAFAVADSLLAFRAAIWKRILLRIAPLTALAAVMIAEPTRLGLAFTVLPVLVLFFVVYGSFGRWVAGRSGPLTSGLGLGLCLAWAVAASTPLFAVS